MHYGALVWTLTRRSSDMNKNRIGDAVSFWDSFGSVRVHWRVHGRSPRLRNGLVLYGKCATS